MPYLTMVTWNCQKVVNSQLGRTRLCQDNFDIIMLQEVPLLFRNAYPPKPHASTQYDVEGNYAIISPKTDNQQNSSACRSYLMLRRQQFTDIKRFTTNLVSSGATTAQRYPAGAKVKVAGEELRIVSAHMTSGGGGSTNLDAVLSPLIEQGAMSSLVFGGDCNAHRGNWTGPVLLPPGATQQTTNNPIDGFTFENGEGTTLEIDQVQTHPAFTLNPNNQPPGCYYNGGRVSDHIPVQARLKYTVTP